MQRISVLFVIWATLLTPFAFAQELGWPREFGNDPNSVILYQPQVESLEGNVLDARAAVAVRLGTDAPPQFGAIWLQARLDTDIDSRIATIREIEILDLSFAEATDTQRDQLSAFLKQEIEAASISIAIDRILADLDIDPASTTAGLKSDPPHILFSTEPAVLVSIEGEAIFEDIPNTSLQRVINTAFVIIKRDNSLFLSGGGQLWYQSNDILGPWQATDNPPDEIAGLVQNDASTEQVQDLTNPPAIIIATEPSELVVASGEPSWVPVEGLSLLYMDNTDSDVFLETLSQRYYLVINGRWYAGSVVSEKLEWENIPNDELPEAFQI